MGFDNIFLKMFKYNYDYVIFRNFKRKKLFDSLRFIFTTM